MELLDFSLPGVTVTVEKELARSAASVWSLWTDQQRMSRWMGFANYQPKLGGRILLDQTAGATEDDPRMILFGRVTEIQERERLAFSWRGFMEDLRVWPADTLVTLDLTSKDGDSCTVRLTHTGFEAQEGWRDPLYRAYHHCWMRDSFFEQLGDQSGDTR